MNLNPKGATVPAFDDQNLVEPVGVRLVLSGFPGVRCCSATTGCVVKCLSGLEFIRFEPERKASTFFYRKSLHGSSLALPTGRTWSDDMRGTGSPPYL